MANNNMNKNWNKYEARTTPEIDIYTSSVTKICVLATSIIKQRHYAD